MSARKRHRTLEGPSKLPRPLVAAKTRAGLPTLAAIASALAIVAATSPASAIVSTKDSGAEEPVVDAATDAEPDAESDAPDAAYCPPDPDGRMLGGVPAYPRVHGTGCGCSGSHDDDETATAFAAAAVVAVFRQLRRQSPSSGGRKARSTTSGSKRK